MAKRIACKTSIVSFDWRKIVSLCIRRRKDLAWSLEYLSARSAVSKKTLIDFESGLTNFKVSTIFSITTALGLTDESDPTLKFIDWTGFVQSCIKQKNEMGMSLTRIQNSASISYKLIKKFERGEKNIGLGSVLKILRVLDITRSRRFNKAPNRQNFLTKRLQKYGLEDPPNVLDPILEWDKIIELSILIRNGLNLTHLNLVEKADVSRPTIINFERGDTHLNLRTIFKIFNALDLENNLNDIDRSKYFKILDWENFVKIALKRREELCLSRNELSKFTNLG